MPPPCSGNSTLTLAKKQDMKRCCFHFHWLLVITTQVCNNITAKLKLGGFIPAVGQELQCF